MKKKYIACYAVLSGLLLAGCDQSASRPELGFGAHSNKAQVVTFDEYRRLESGMSYRQVVAIIGAEGQEIARSKIDGIPGVMAATETIMYQWVNSDGGNMNAMFQNDRLMQKAQFGLR